MSVIRSAAFLCTLIFASAVTVLAEQPASPADADAAYSHQQWQKAEALYAALVQSDPDNGRYWYRLGTSARANKHYDAALKAFEQAKAKGAGKGLPVYISDYEIASTYAAKGDAQQAFDALKASADAGYSQPKSLEDNAEWSSLRSDPRFAPLLKQVKHNVAPCEDTPEARQFDFWLGDWDVVSSLGGPKQGTSHISREMNGCVIWENWTSAGAPYFGKSYNTYNANLKRWEQYWVDNAQGVIFFFGNLKDGAMDYWTDDIPQPNGTKLRRHLQFFNLSPDKVRQFSQGSTDGGKTWNVEYDFTYNRHKPQVADAEPK
jgi:tetratricopeptide (TPR) repeat protein